MDFTANSEQAWAGNVNPTTTNCFGTGWSWNAGECVLTLSGLDFTTMAQTAITLPDGATIHLDSGTNSYVTSSYSGTDSSKGIYCKGTLTVTGGGTLTATGALATGPDACSYGVQTNGGLTVSGGRLTARGSRATGNGAYSFGVYCTDSNVTVNGGKLEAYGDYCGTAAGSSYGVYLYSGSVTVENGVLCGYGGKAEGEDKESCGVKAKSSSIEVRGGALTARGGETTGSGGKSYGAYAGGNVTASGGTLEATGGNATGSGGASYGAYAGGAITASSGTLIANGGSGSYSYGAYAEDRVNVNGGTFTANGGGATGGSYGVGAGLHSITVSSGTLNATGGSATSVGSGAYAGAGIAVTGGMFTATGGSELGSYGVSFGRPGLTITISGGTVTATGNCALMYAPVLQTGIAATASTDISGSGATGYVPANNDTYKWFRAAVGTSVAAPAFSPAAGTYSNAQSVTLSCTTAGTVIRYTLDGSEPNVNSAVYSAPISVTSSTTIKAKAFVDGAASETVSAAYTISGGGGGIALASMFGEPQSGGANVVTLPNAALPSGGAARLSGAGLNPNDALLVQGVAAGGSNNAMRELAGGNEVVGVYEISLRSGTKSTGNSMQLRFSLGAQYAGQSFTLVHQKADATYEYFYDTADANGNAAFGPLYELSPFVLVKGLVVQPSTVASDVIPPQTGDSGTVAGYAMIALAAAVTVTLAVRRKRCSK